MKASSLLFKNLELTAFDGQLTPEVRRNRDYFAAVLVKEAEDAAAQHHVEAATASLPPEELAVAALPRKLRWFMDTAPAGNEYLVPAELRMEWDAWTMAAEDSSELPVLPTWAKPLKDQIRFVEFEMPVEVMQ